MTALATTADPLAFALAVGGCLLSGIMAVLWWRARRRLADVAARLGRLPALARQGDAAPGGDAVERAVALTERTLATVDQRLDKRHLMTGLPTREPLFELIAADTDAPTLGGLLGTVALLDFERLVAFDAALAERTFVALVDRVVRMVAGRRMIAHVDRSNLAIWFGSDVSVEAARAELEAIGYALGDAIRDGEREILPEVRIGAARFPQEGATPQLLLTRALAALRHGGEAPEDNDPVARARDEYSLEQDLRQAIARGEFELHYQPLVDASAAKVCGAEALLRWHHPTRGMVSPGKFVPIMEAAGLADEVGLWTLNAAMREARAWQNQGLGELRVAVNVSGHQLERDDLPTLIERTLGRHSLAAGQLEIELTETVAAGDPSRAAAIFDLIRRTGVRIAIDDFGTGFSSFSTLRQLKFDKIKIDREFVTAVDTRRDSQAICSAVIALGRGLGIRVLAEGVERREEYEWLRAHGCAHFQGYLFSPPLAADAFVAFVKDHAGLARLTAVDPASLRHRIAERFIA